MSHFNTAIKTILKHEGGFSDDQHDPGGATNYGISLRYLNTLMSQKPELLNEIDINKNATVDPYDIQHLSIEEAIRLYQEEWWDKYGYGNINNQKLATKVFDLAVNMGAHQAALLLQRAYCEVVDQPSILVDGVLGEKSYHLINQLDVQKTNLLLSTFCDLAADFYQQLAEKKPNFSKFLKGWLNRLYDESNAQKTLA